MKYLSNKAVFGDLDSVSEFHSLCPVEGTSNSLGELAFQQSPLVGTFQLECMNISLLEVSGKTFLGVSTIHDSNSSLKGETQISFGSLAFFRTGSWTSICRLR